MAANPQEVLIKALSESTMGRRSVFEPDDYRKGNAKREPADVAWFTRDVVVLMYLKAGQKGWQTDAEGNLRQAKGWLGAWRGGRSLEGSVVEGAVSIPYDRSRSVLVLSVSADPTLSEIVRHDDAAADLGVDACATVSQAFMEAVAGDYLGVADIGLLLYGWPKARAQVPTITDIEFFHEYCLTGLAKAAERAGWQHPGRPVDDAQFSHVVDIIRRLRSVVETGPGAGTKPMTHPNEFFSDFMNVEQWQLFNTFGRAIKLVREGSPYQQVEAVIGSYRIAVQVAAHASAAAGEATGKLTPPGADLILNYALGVDMMLFGVKPGLALRQPTAARQVMLGLKRQAASRFVNAGRR